MTFDVQSADLDQLAKIASKGGIEALEELANGKQPELKTEAPAEAEVTNAEAEVTEDPLKEEPPKQEDKDHATAVSTKDGKGTIPYSVLKGARERASQFEQENSVLRQQIEELTSRVNAPATPSEEAPVSVDEADARISEMQGKVAALKDDFPELAELYTAQMDLLKATRQQLVSIQQKYDTEQQQRVDAEQRRSADEVQSAIDANQHLVLWQQKAGPEWSTAVEMDNMLRNQPEWVGKSIAERFDRVVELVKVMRPDAELPATTSADSKPQATPAKRPPVNSLSDIPGGVPPAAGTREQLDELSSVALGNKLSSMSNEQITEYLASLGM